MAHLLGVVLLSSFVAWGLVSSVLVSAMALTHGTDAVRCRLENLGWRHSLKIPKTARASPACPIIEKGWQSLAKTNFSTFYWHIAYAPSSIGGGCGLPRKSPLCSREHLDSMSKAMSRDSACSESRATLWSSHPSRLHPFPCPFHYPFHCPFPYPFPCNYPFPCPFPCSFHYPFPCPFHYPFPCPRRPHL